MDKIKPVQIILFKRADPSYLSDRPQIAFSWEEADQILQDWAMLLSNDRGFFYVLYKVTFEDGHVLGGTMLLKYQHKTQWNLLAKQIKSHLMKMAMDNYGEPNWLLLNMLEGALNSYQIGYALTQKIT